MSNTRRLLAGFLMLGTLLLSGPVLASAGEGAGMTLRLFGGVENGAAVGLTSGNRVLSIEAGQAFLPSTRLHSLTEMSLTVRTPGPGAWVGGRLGYQLGMFSYEHASARDVSHTLDVGVVGGLASAGGHTLSLEVGAERVQRSDRFFCCDSTLAESSLGVRAMLAGQLEISPHLAAFARLGVRTAEHLLEIKVLPVLLAGMALRY
jgi:hypothetical protein